MKCSLGISNFLEELSSLSHSVVFLYFFASVSTILRFMSQSAAFKEYMFHDRVQGHLGVVETDAKK